jgi:hypothetical protein
MLGPESPMHRSLLAVAVLVVACDGSDTNVSRVYPNLLVTPGSLEFGGVAVDYSSSLDLLVLNGGLAVLEVESVEIVGDDGGVFTVDTTPFRLAQDEQFALPVQFAPPTYLDYGATLVLKSNDEESGVFEVPLTGTGIYAPAPDIAVDPSVVDFGVVPAGTTDFVVVQLRNEGTATLTIDSAQQYGSGAFTLQGDSPDGYSVPGGQSLSLVWQYAPTGDAGDNGSFVISSNDPDEPELTMTLLGNGGGDFEYPTADIDCQESVRPRTLVYLDGRGSTDPDDLALTYEWTLEEVPAGSAVEKLVNATLSIAEMTTDIAGEYTVGLVVTNSDGVSSAKRLCRMDAIPEEELHVELSWNTTRADLDLHLLLEEADLFDVPGDCNYCNQLPDWGVPVSKDDDPSLDLDATAGLGPENINIRVPVDGKYRIVVHDFDDQGDGASLATVRVYAYGVLVHEDSETMEYNNTWEVGLVNWPEGTVGVTDVYRMNYLYDDNGDPLLDDKGVPLPGPRGCPE